MQSFEQLTVDDNVTGLTSTVYHPKTFVKAQSALIAVEDAEIRFTTDGQDPTDTYGHTLGMGDVVKLSSSDEIKKFQAIRVGSVDATLDVTYSFGS